MTHCIGDNTVVEFVEGTLKVSEASTVERHIARCEACRMRVIAIGTSPSRLANAPAPPAGIGAHLLLQPGTRVDRFIISHRLGHGGMGVVFAAYDPHLQRRVALKLLRTASQDSQTVRRSSDELLDEARIMASLHHPNIVTAYDTGTFREESYLVMELVAGLTLGEWLRRWGKRPWTAIVDCFVQAGRALAHAHSHGLAHGDFKPENVLVDNSDRARVTDFGLACQFSLEPANPSEQNAGTRPAMVMGTPRYMAPEQYRGRAADARSDQFSFCIALFEALYGHHPCTHDSPRSILELPRDQAWVPVPADTDVPDWIARVLCKGLSPNPTARYASMYQLLADLAPGKRTRNPRKLASVATLALAAACALGVIIGHRLADTPVGSTNGRIVAKQLTTAPERDGRPASRSTGTSNAGTSNATGASVPGRRAPAATSTPAASRQTAADRNSQHHAYASGAETERLSLVKDEHQWLSQQIATLQSDLRSTRQTTRPSPRLARLGRQVTEIKTRHTAQERRISNLENQRDRPRRSMTHGSSRTRQPTGGLSRTSLRRSIVPHRRELEVCFQEWRDRQPQGRHSLTLFVRINRAGKAAVHSYRGLSDRVARECSALALEAISYRPHRRPTAAAVTFHSSARALNISIRPNASPPPDSTGR